jgi:eukaryotic-like serine/threonine-protein kinase
MGEVWRARDTRLRREVALKTLPALLANDPERLARLEREAQLLASLNHPHIATIHGIEEQDGARVLVLELVAGETLEDRLRGGPIGIDEALSLALQLAQGLEAAHDAGVIHRDLKPANTKITPDHRIKILDFGIAKAIAAASGEEGATVTLDPTRTGTIMGTPAYMSPEQARGEAVGVQTDIWAFGALLYEMLTGTSSFRRKTTAETLVSVLESQPDYSAVPLDTPPLVRRLVERCLEKSLSRRMQDIGDVRILLEEALASPDLGTSGVRAPRTRRRAAWIAAGVAAAAFAVVALWLATNRQGTEKPAALIHVSVPFPELGSAFPFGQRYLAISADGSTIAFVGGGRLYIRRFDRKDSISVATGPASNPFFSPDGDWIGLFTENALIKIASAGGAPEVITAVTDRPAGGAWRMDGRIVYATTDGLYEISANGGERKFVTRPDRGHKEELYAFPQFLPGGQSVVLTLVSQEPTQAPQTVMLDLNTLERHVVLTGSSARYMTGGQLLYATDSRLHAVAFDSSTGRVTSKPEQFPDVDIAVAPDNGAANFAVSDTGTVIFAPPTRQGLRVLAWLTRDGDREPLPLEPQNYGYAMVSPDGSRIAVERTTRGNRDIWLVDLKRMIQTQLTDGPTEDMLPVWSADGSRIFFGSRRLGNFDIYSQTADGASPARLEFAAPELQVPNGVTPDGSKLIVLDRFNDLFLLDLARSGQLQPLLHSGFDERLGEVSPDGRWIAYESDESGKQFEVILRSFPNVSERREVISVGGGRYPRWGPKGSNELYYVRADGALMAASIRLSPFELGSSKKLFDWRKPRPNVSGLEYDVAPDGRFLVSELAETIADRQTAVSVILNWRPTLQPSAGQ